MGGWREFETVVDPECGGEHPGLLAETGHVAQYPEVTSLKETHGFQLQGVLTTPEALHIAKTWQ